MELLEPTFPVLEDIPRLDGPGAAENRQCFLRGAELLIADQDYLLAKNLYSYLLKHDNSDSDALIGLGLCLLELGNLTSAAKCFEALRETSFADEAALGLGRTLSVQREDERAVEVFRSIKNPTRLSKAQQFQLFKELGNAENRLGHLEDASAAYQEALTLDPRSDVLHVNMGMLELQRQQVDVAVSCFAKALELNEKNSRAHCGLGMAALVKGDSETALKEIEIAIQLDDSNLAAKTLKTEMGRGNERNGKAVD